MNKLKPLTLEQLIKMDGEPILFVSLKDNKKNGR